jgi:hypothetical protein
MHASESENLDMVKMLLDAKAEVNVQDLVSKPFLSNTLHDAMFKPIFLPQLIVFGLFQI